MSTINKKSFNKCAKVDDNNHFWYKKYVYSFAKEYDLSVTFVKLILPYDIENNHKGYYYMRGYA